MTNSQRLSTVRSALQSWINSQEDKAGSEICSEAFLIRDGFFCGRRFDTESYLGTWFIEEDELKIHAIADGSLLCVMNSEEIQAAAEQHPTVLVMPKREDESSVGDAATDEGDEEDLRRAA